MCYAIPAKVVSIQDNFCILDYFGEERKALLDIENVEVGDYIYAQGGISVRKIPHQEAAAVLATWQDIFFELKKTDSLLSKVDQEKLPANALAVLQKINLRQQINKQEMLSLLTLNTANELKVLYELANNIRQREHGNASCVHGILEFSNYCGQSCWYCGIRQEREIKRYRLTPEQIIAAAQSAVDTYGFKALVLQSGEDYWYDINKLTAIVQSIRAMGVLVFLSIGMRSIDTYQKLFTAGARAALLRFETSNQKIFHRLKPGVDFTERLELIKNLKKIGYIVATGFMLGLPEESAEDLVNNIALTQYLDPDMYSFGPLIPTTNTPLANQKKTHKDDVLKAIAVARLANPKANILVTTALETLDHNTKQEALLAGANSLMINITPTEYRDLYEIYEGKNKNLEIGSSIKNTTNLLYTLGRAPTDIGLL